MGDMSLTHHLLAHRRSNHRSWDGCKKGEMNYGTHRKGYAHLEFPLDRVWPIVLLVPVSSTLTPPCLGGVTGQVKTGASRSPVRALDLSDCCDMLSSSSPLLFS